MLTNYNKMDNGTADGVAKALPKFNDLGCSVTPFFFFWWIIFLYQFCTFTEKMKEIFQLEVWIFDKFPIQFFLNFSLSVHWFQMPLEGLNFVKMLAAFGIIYYATDPLLPLCNRPTSSTIWLRSFCISNTSNSLSDCSKNLKKIH